MRRLVTDTLIIAERNLVRLPRAPDLLLAFTVQPIMFVLLFRYVFGGAINTHGVPYVEFLIPGIIVQNIAFGGFVTALGLNEDVHKGLIDRFRSLPMARPAVLAGRTFADIVTNSLSVTVLVVTGLIIGFSFTTSLVDVIAGIGLLLLFGYAFSWVFAFLGLIVSSPESANSVGFIAVFPLTFVSSAFVPVNTMPSVLRAFANVNPFTIIVDAMRHLWVGGHSFPAGNSVWGGGRVVVRDHGRVRAARGVEVPASGGGVRLAPTPGLAYVAGSLRAGPVGPVKVRPAASGLPAHRSLSMSQSRPLAHQLFETGPPQHHPRPLGPIPPSSSISTTTIAFARCQNSLMQVAVLDLVRLSNPILFKQLTQPAFRRDLLFECCHDQSMGEIV